MGYPTVAFTEAQMYNVLKFLPNETMDLTYFTIERMILVSLKGTPTTTQSRREHFRKRTRAQTPGQVGDSDSSLNSKMGVAGYEHMNVEEETRNLTSCEESNGTTEMPLVSKSFKKYPAKEQLFHKVRLMPLTWLPRGPMFQDSLRTPPYQKLWSWPEQRMQSDNQGPKKQEDKEGTTAWCSHEKGILQEDWVDKILQFRSHRSNS